MKFLKIIQFYFNLIKVIFVISPIYSNAEVSGIDSYIPFKMLDPKIAEKLIEKYKEPLSQENPVGMVLYDKTDFSSDYKINIVKNECHIIVSQESFLVREQNFNNLPVFFILTRNNFYSFKNLISNYSLKECKQRAKSSLRNVNLNHMYLDYLEVQPASNKVNFNQVERPMEILRYSQLSGQPGMLSIEVNVHPSFNIANLNISRGPIVSYKGQVDENHLPHGDGKLFFNVKSNKIDYFTESVKLESNFTHGYPNGPSIFDFNKSHIQIKTNLIKGLFHGKTEFYDEGRPLIIVHYDMGKIKEKSEIILFQQNHKYQKISRKFRFLFHNNKLELMSDESLIWTFQDSSQELIVAKNQSVRSKVNSVLKCNYGRNISESTISVNSILLNWLNFDNIDFPIDNRIIYDSNYVQFNNSFIENNIEENGKCNYLINSIKYEFQLNEFTGFPEGPLVGIFEDGRTYRGTIEQLENSNRFEFSLNIPGQVHKKRDVFSKIGYFLEKPGSYLWRYGDNLFRRIFDDVCERGKSVNDAKSCGVNFDIQYEFSNDEISTSAGIQKTQDTKVKEIIKNWNVHYEQELEKHFQEKIIEIMNQQDLLSRSIANNYEKILLYDQILKIKSNSYSNSLSINQENVQFATNDKNHFYEALYDRVVFQQQIIREFDVSKLQTLSKNMIYNDVLNEEVLNQLISYEMLQFKNETRSNNRLASLSDAVEVYNGFKIYNYCHSQKEYLEQVYENSKGQDNEIRRLKISNSIDKLNYFGTLRTSVTVFETVGLIAQSFVGLVRFDLDKFMSLPRTKKELLSIGYSSADFLIKYSEIKSEYDFEKAYIDEVVVQALK